MKRIIKSGLIIIILFLILGCAKTKGKKFAEKFVNELEYVDKNISDDFFITKYHPNYEKITKTYPFLVTKIKFLEAFVKYNFLEAKIKKIDFIEEYMIITFLARPEVRGLPEFAKMFNRRKVTINALYIKGEWKFYFMSIDTSGIDFFDELGSD